MIMKEVIYHLFSSRFFPCFRRENFVKDAEDQMIFGELT